MARIGGKRSGAGRPRGAKNKRTMALEAARANGELPLDFMLRVMRNEAAPVQVRTDMAKAAAPYIHPRLNAIRPSGEDGGPLVIILNEDDSKL